MRLFPELVQVGGSYVYAEPSEILALVATTAYLYSVDDVKPGDPGFGELTDCTAIHYHNRAVVVVRGTPSEVRAALNAELHRRFDSLVTEEEEEPPKPRLL